MEGRVHIPTKYTKRPAAGCNTSTVKKRKLYMFRFLYIYKNDTFFYADYQQ